MRNDLTEEKGLGTELVTSSTGGCFLKPKLGVRLDKKVASLNPDSHFVGRIPPSSGKSRTSLAAVRKRWHTQPTEARTFSVWRHTFGAEAFSSEDVVPRLCQLKFLFRKLSQHPCANPSREQGSYRKCFINRCDVPSSSQKKEAVPPPVLLSSQFLKERFLYC